MNPNGTRTLQDRVKEQNRVSALRKRVARAQKELAPLLAANASGVPDSVAEAAKALEAAYATLSAEFNAAGLAD